MMRHDGTCDGARDGTTEHKGNNGMFTQGYTGRMRRSSCDGTGMTEQNIF